MTSLNYNPWTQANLLSVWKELLQDYHNPQTAPAHQPWPFLTLMSKAKRPFHNSISLEIQGASKIRNYCFLPLTQLQTFTLPSGRELFVLHSACVKLWNRPWLGAEVG